MTNALRKQSTEPGLQTYCFYFDNQAYLICKTLKTVLMTKNDLSIFSIITLK